MIIRKPQNVDSSLYYFRYLDLVDGTDLILALKEREVQTLNVISKISDKQLTYSYGKGKWSIARLLQHICDAERVFAYRTLRFLRSDATDLAGFDEDLFANNGGIAYTTVADFITEYKAIRTASISLFQCSDLKNIDFPGRANGLDLTPRLIGWLMVGHDLHHLNILEERYLK